MPKPFALQRNTTIRSIKAPKTEIGRLPRATSSDNLDSLSFTKPADTGVGDLKTPGSLKPDSNGTSNGSNKSTGPKPVPLCPKPDLLAKTKPEPTRNADKTDSDHQTGTNIKQNVTATSAEDLKEVPPRSRTKSLGAQDKRKLKQRPVGETTTSKTDADFYLPIWPGRNRLSMELTSRFESPSQLEMEVNSVRRDSEKERPPNSPSAESNFKSSKPLVETGEMGGEEVSGRSIKRRISLLFDRSTASQHRDSFNKRDATPSEISVDIKQRIKNLSLDSHEPRIRLPSTGALKCPIEKTPSNSDEFPFDEKALEKPAESKLVQNGSHRPIGKQAADKPPTSTEVQPVAGAERMNAELGKVIENKPDIKVKAKEAPTSNFGFEKNVLIEDKNSIDEENNEVEEDKENYIPVPLYQSVGIGKDTVTKREEEILQKEEHLEKERKQLERERLLEEERTAKTEIARQQEEERKHAGEEKCLEDERRKQERKQKEESQRQMEERRKQEEDERKQVEKEREKQRKRERLEKERQLEEEMSRIEEERKKERQREEERLRLEKERELEEEKRRNEEERLRQEREKEREMEERRGIEEEERLRQEREKERLKKEKEMDDERRRIKEMERLKEEEQFRQQREKERIRKEKEMEEGRRQIEGMERQKEEERLRQEKDRLQKEKEIEEERRRIEEMERQKEEARLRQEREMERIRKEKEKEEERRQIEKIERQKEEERLRQEREMERLRKEREMEEKRRRIEEIERQKEEERLRQVIEKDRLRKEREMEEERRRIQEMERLKQEREKERRIEEERQIEEERLRQERVKERLRKEKEMEEERQRDEERFRQEREMERLRKEREMEEKRRRIEEIERQKEEERLRQVIEKDRLRKEREMEEERRRIQEMERLKQEREKERRIEEERQIEEERLRQERVKERLRKEKEMEEERRQIEEERQREEERLKQEKENERLKKEREMEKCIEVERLREEVPTSYNLISFDSEEPVLSQSLVSSVQNANVSPQLTEVLYDDFSVKPRRWGTQARCSSTPSPSREPSAVDLIPERLDPKPESRSNGYQGLLGNQVYVDDLIGFEPAPSNMQNSSSDHTESRNQLQAMDSKPEDWSKPKTESSALWLDGVTSHEGQLQESALEEDEVAEQDLIKKSDNPDEINNTVDNLGTESRIVQALQRVKRKNKQTDSDPTNAPGQEEHEILHFPESSGPLLDSSVFRSKVDLGRKRTIKRSRPSRAVRQRAALPALTAGTHPNWRFHDSTDVTAQCSNGGDSELKEEPSKDSTSSPSPSQSKRVPLFPGMDQSALMAQLKRRSGPVETDTPSEGLTTPPVPAHSPRTPTMSLGPRVLPPVDSKDSGSGSSPSWLLELKSKKRTCQPESEA
ncbi:trichohyalin-like [Myxocyprinus asiaticus]|uniref:trichohyalin-like n=1 Tax=Myxocyprinus asiaticus TaxID=70543 RepID=UPI00222232BA|nr:trichohyalin-like [Myxocyprinus asiaticus]